MPLSQEEFEVGQSDLTVPLANLLRGLADQAFTAEEIRQLLMDIEGRQAAKEDIVHALEALVAQQRIRMKEIAGQQWYNMRRRRLGFLKE